jgi:hypothetical protein
MFLRNVGSYKATRRNIPEDIILQNFVFLSTLHASVNFSVLNYFHNNFKLKVPKYLLFFSICYFSKGKNKFRDTLFSDMINLCSI